MKQTYGSAVRQTVLISVDEDRYLMFGDAALKPSITGEGFIGSTNCVSFNSTSMRHLADICDRVEEIVRENEGVK